jgi:hypothetical protein
MQPLTGRLPAEVGAAAGRSGGAQTLPAAAGPWRWHYVTVTNLFVPQGYCKRVLASSLFAQAGVDTPGSTLETVADPFKDGLDH